MATVKKAIGWIVILGLLLFFISLILIPVSILGLAMRDVDDIYREPGDIAVVRLEGPIVDAAPLARSLRVIGKNREIKGVLVRIDSPGGGVAASQEIYEEAKKLAVKKRVYVSMGTVAASGGYYVAAAAGKIFAMPGSITGSIGVIMENVELTELVDLARVRLRTFKSGEMKDAGSALRPMTPEEKAYLQGILDQMHAQFMSAVATGRAMDSGKVRSLADGRVFTGEEAKKLGLIDELGTFYDTLDALKRDLGFKGDVRLLSPDEDLNLRWLHAIGQKKRALLKMIDFSGLSALTGGALENRFAY